MLINKKRFGSSARLMAHCWLGRFEDASLPEAKKKPRKLPKWLRRKTPLKPGKTKIASRARFIEWGKNCTKSYRRKFSDAEVLAKAEECRRKRLADPMPAEEIVATILTRLGVMFEREKIWQNGDRWVATDFHIPSVNLVLELDGQQHRDQRLYDHQRSMWLARTHGLHVVRFWNSEVESGTAEQRIKEMLGLGVEVSAVKPSTS